MSTQTSARRRLQRVSVSNRIRRAWVPRPPTRIGRQEFFVEPEHIVVVDAWVAQRIEGAEGGLVGRSTKKQTEILQCATILSTESSRKNLLIKSVQRYFRSSSLVPIGFLCWFRRHEIEPPSIETPARSVLRVSRNKMQQVGNSVVITDTTGDVLTVGGDFGYAWCGRL